jgi:hypothetical protein
MSPLTLREIQLSIDSFRPSRITVFDYSLFLFCFFLLLLLLLATNERARTRV